MPGSHVQTAGGLRRSPSPRQGAKTRTAPPHHPPEHRRIGYAKEGRRALLSCAAILAGNCRLVQYSNIRKFLKPQILNVPRHLAYQAWQAALTYDPTGTPPV